MRPDGEAPIFTMSWYLKVALHHVFTSEIHPSARKFSMIHVQPDILFGDVQSRINRMAELGRSRPSASRPPLPLFFVQVGA